MKPTEKYRLDERDHVEKPLLNQLSSPGWEIIDLTEEKQTNQVADIIKTMNKHS